MSKISNSIYRNLNPKQRLAACIEASARNDEVEYDRLLDTCPKKSILTRDPEFADRVNELFGMTIAVECDLRECVLMYFVFLQSKPTTALASLQNFANIRTAWERILASRKIQPNSMQRVGPPVSLAFLFIEDLVPEADPATTKKIELGMRERLIDG